MNHCRAIKSLNSIAGVSFGIASNASSRPTAIFRSASRSLTIQGCRDRLAFTASHFQGTIHFGLRCRSDERSSPPPHPSDSFLASGSRNFVSTISIVARVCSLMEIYDSHLIGFNVPRISFSRSASLCFFRPLAEVLRP